MITEQELITWAEQQVAACPEFNTSTPRAKRQAVNSQLIKILLAKDARNLEDYDKPELIQLVLELYAEGTPSYNATIQSDLIRQIQELPDALGIATITLPELIEELEVECSES